MIKALIPHQQKIPALIGCLAVYFSLIPVQLTNSTVIQELSTIFFSGSLYPGAYIWGGGGLFPGAYKREACILGAYIRGAYIPGGLYPGAYILGAYIRGLITGSLYLGDFYPGGLYPGGLISRVSYLGGL